MVKSYDSSAIGSDVPRDFKQYAARKVASFVVAVLGLNKPSFLATEIVQQIQPVCDIPTKFGGMQCKGGHVRLRWRALTFYSEEPETIVWLESLEKDDLLWDVGANVGLYSIYVALLAKCKVLAIEPEAQNYALLIENIVLNNAQEYVEATNLAVSSGFGVGKLRVHALTKSGAYNQFFLKTESSLESRRISALSSSVQSTAVSQLQIGVSLDDLVSKFGFEYPTHIKIDVDGNEPDIIAGATQVLSNERCKSVLIELKRDEPEHMAIVEKLTQLGYSCVSERSNWESRTNRERESEYPSINMIFSKA